VTLSSAEYKVRSSYRRPTAPPGAQASPSLGLDRAALAEVLGPIDLYFREEFTAAGRTPPLNFLHRWLGACAVFPVLRWPLTVELGRALAQLSDDPAPDEFEHLTLGRLAWFRQGRMPDGARALMAASLSATDLAVVRTTVTRFMLDALDAPGRAALTSSEMEVAARQLAALAAGAPRHALQSDRLLKQVLRGGTPRVVLKDSERTTPRRLTPSWRSVAVVVAVLVVASVGLYLTRSWWWPKPPPVENPATAAAMPNASSTSSLPSAVEASTASTSAPPIDAGEKVQTRLRPAPVASDSANPPLDIESVRKRVLARAEAAISPPGLPAISPQQDVTLDQTYRAVNDAEYAMEDEGRRAKVDAVRARTVDELNDILVRLDARTAAYSTALSRFSKEFTRVSNASPKSANGSATPPVSTAPPTDAGATPHARPGGETQKARPGNSQTDRAGFLGKPPSGSNPTQAPANAPSTNAGAKPPPGANGAAQAARPESTQRDGFVGKPASGSSPTLAPANAAQSGAGTKPPPGANIPTQTARPANGQGDGFVGKPASGGSTPPPTTNTPANQISGARLPSKLPPQNVNRGRVVSDDELRTLAMQRRGQLYNANPGAEVEVTIGRENGRAVLNVSMRDEAGTYTFTEDAITHEKIREQGP
jgi:hypothetical protein